jgi:hypothetical protein
MGHRWHEMRRMHFACWITKATDTQYEIFIAFPRQKLLHALTSVLRYIQGYSK